MTNEKLKWFTVHGSQFIELKMSFLRNLSSRKRGAGMGEIERGDLSACQLFNLSTKRKGGKRTVDRG